MVSYRQTVIKPLHSEVRHLQSVRLDYCCWYEYFIQYPQVSKCVYYSKLPPLNLINQLQCIEISDGINTSNELAICQLDNVRKNEPFVALWEKNKKYYDKQIFCVGWQRGNNLNLISCNIIRLSQFESIYLAKM